MPDNEDKCRCGADGEPLHACPLREEIRGDNETLCNCCKECTYQCGMDI